MNSHGEVIGMLNDIADNSTKSKGLAVNVINGQIVLDRSSLV